MAKATLRLKPVQSVAKTARPEAQTAKTTVTAMTNAAAETATVVDATVTVTAVALLVHRTSQSQRSPRMTF